MSAAPSPLLELDGVHAAYGKTKALHGVSLRVFRGEIVAMLGPNGAGKSTTLRTISGLLRASEGRVSYDGRPIGRMAVDQIVRLGIAHCPEERHVWPELTVHENLRLGAYICKEKDEIARRTEAILDRFPRLRERAVQLAGTLSGGEQQMLAIGRALMSQPKLLMLDEPSLGLSPVLVEEVLTALRELCDRQGVSILLVEQNVHNALSVASRAYVFETGRVVAEDESQNLLNAPDLLRAYLGG